MTEWYSEPNGWWRDHAPDDAAASVWPYLGQWRWSAWGPGRFANAASGTTTTPEAARDAADAALTRLGYPPPQPAPSGGHGDVWAELIEAHPNHPLVERMRARRELGIQRYGVPLGYDDGRDARRDALEEALDLAVYLWRLGERELAEQALEIANNIVRNGEVK